MKKIGSLVLAVLLAMSVTACSDSKTVSKTKATDATTTAASSADATKASGEETGSVEVTLDTTGNFVFKYENTDILLGSTDTAGILASLGDAKSTLDVPSCAHDGTDHVYTYTNMVLTTYQATGSETAYVSDVLITSDLVKTPEGLEIGMTADDAKAKYGEPDEATDVTMTYKRGTSILLVTLKNNAITSLEYQIP
ncbi:MAG: hypothetical protein J5752_11625 [Clostridiales bacterium]|nr:hypothetical protein [Clostridiales bacterium]